MAQQGPAAASVTARAQAVLQQRAVATMRVAANLTRARPDSPILAITAALWGDHDAYRRTAHDAVSYVDALARLSPGHQYPGPPPTPTSRDTLAPLLVTRLRDAAARTGAANANFALANQLRRDDPKVREHRVSLLAVQTARIAHDAAVGAWREAAQARMAQIPAVVGWRRIASPDACAACLALMDGSVHPIAEQMVVHTRDRCLAEPAVVGVNDRQWTHPTGEQIFKAKDRADQDALFAGRGGHDKAQLIRDGHIAFSDLARVATDRLGHTPIALSETPLSDLQTPRA